MWDCLFCKHKHNIAVLICDVVYVSHCQVLLIRKFFVPDFWLVSTQNDNAGIHVSPVFMFMCSCQVDDFLQALVSYDKEHIPESCLTVVKQQYLKNPEFHPDLVRTKSTAAAGLCAWTINIVRYYEVRKCLQISCSYNKCQYIFLYFLQDGLFFIVELFFLHFADLLWCHSKEACIITS